jgi:hypothetical protein
VEIPPGAYILWAEHTNGKVRTHKAVVHVGLEPRADVLLLPDVEPGHPEPHDCTITITGVVGIGSPTPGTVRVTGTASGCVEVKVTVTGSGAGGSKSVHVPVGANGDWTADLSQVPGIACGRPAFARAECVADPECNDTKEMDRLECLPYM